MKSRVRESAIVLRHSRQEMPAGGPTVGRTKNVNNLWQKLLTDRISGAILAIIKNCESIEVRCASVFSAYGIGFPAGKKG